MDRVIVLFTGAVLLIAVSVLIYLSVSIGAVLLIAALVLIYLSRNKIEMELRRSYVIWASWIWVRSHTHFLAIALFLVAVFLALSGWILYYTEVKFVPDGQSNNGWLSLIRSPGSVFAALMAVFTACGFFVTVTRISEIGSRITRYDDLLVRAARLLSHEVNLFRTRHEHRNIWMVGATPLHGNVSEAGTGYYKKYHQALENARRDLTLHILHLSTEGLREFYSRFAGEKAEAQKALDDSARFINHVNENARDRLREIRRTDDPQVKKTLPVPHRTGNLLEEVGYRLLITEDKAIFYVPFFLPPEADTPSPDSAASQDHHRNNGRVEMLGFETEDKFVIEQLKTNFDFLARFSPQAGAESTDSVDVASGHRINMSIMLPVDTQ